MRILIWMDPVRTSRSHLPSQVPSSCSIQALCFLLNSASPSLARTHAAPTPLLRVWTRLLYKGLHSRHNCCALLTTASEAWASHIQTHAGHALKAWNEIADALAAVGRTSATNAQPDTAEVTDRLQRAIDGFADIPDITCQGFTLAYNVCRRAATVASAEATFASAATRTGHRSARCAAAADTGNGVERTS